MLFLRSRIRSIFYPPWIPDTGVKKGTGSRIRMRNTVTDVNSLLDNDNSVTRRQTENAASQRPNGVCDTVRYVSPVSFSPERLWQEDVCCHQWTDALMSLSPRSHPKLWKSRRSPRNNHKQRSRTVPAYGKITGRYVLYVLKIRYFYSKSYYIYKQCCGSGSGSRIRAAVTFWPLSGIRDRFFADPGSQTHILRAWWQFFG